MEPPIEKKNGNGSVQRNLNTILLAICVSLSGWLLWSVNDLDTKIAGIMPQINQNSSAIQGVNTVNQKQQDKIDELSTRLTKLEQLESDLSHKN